MSTCQPIGTTTCSYLGTLGCEIPGWKEKMDRLSFLEVRVLYAKNTPEEMAEYKTLSYATDATSNLNSSIYGYSCFCPPELR